MRKFFRFIVAFILGDILSTAVLLSFFWGVIPFLILVGVVYETMLDCIAGVESLCFDLDFLNMNWERRFDESLLDDYHLIFIAMLVIPGLFFGFYWGAKSVNGEGWKFWKW